MVRAAIVRTDRYSRGAVVFHWTIAALVIVNLAIGLLHESLLDGLNVLPLHKSIGISVLVLSIGRIGWRLAHPVPPMPATMAGWERSAARAVHFLFYALILLMPLSGWAMTSVGRNGGPPRPLSWFGLFDVPALPISSGVAGVAHEVHEIAGYGFAALVVLHIAAALRHHFLIRDGVLARMIPGLKRAA